MDRATAASLDWADGNGTVDLWLLPRVPGAILVCPLGAVACLYLFWLAFVDYWYLLVSWIVIGALVYGFYGYRHSKLRNARQAVR